MGYKWDTFYPNFDNIGNSLISLFVISNLEGWYIIMYRARDFKLFIIVNYYLLLLKIIKLRYKIIKGPVRDNY